VAALRAEADEVVCLQAPTHLGAVGSYYVDFGQTSDEEVLALLDSAAVAAAPTPRSRGWATG
jgi:putative phosphoribosyl transferase